MLTLRRHPARELGFTVVELIIVMVILGIVMAMIGGALTGGWSASRHVTEKGAAEASSNALFTIMSSDVRQALAPGRAVGGITKEELRTAISTGANPEYADVLKATSTELWLATDAVADDNGAIECVTYVEDATGLHRRVYADAGCGGTALDDQLLIGPRSTKPTSAKPRFTYTLAYNTAIFGATSGQVVDISTCAKAPGVVLPDDIGSGVPAALDAGSVRATDFIVAVEVNGLAEERNGAVEFDADSRFALQSRSTSNYRSALGCGY